MVNRTSSNIIDLNRSLQQKETEIELLQKTFTEIGSELDIEKIFRIVSERARTLINAETLLIPLLDDNCETYTYRGGAGRNADEIVGESLPLDYGVCGWVWKHKKPWWQGMMNELSDDDKNRWEHEAGNMILVPLQGKRHFLGGIAGLNKKDGNGFRKKDLNLLQLFASIVSIAIENAMAVKSMDDTHKLNQDYRNKLEYLSLYDPVTALPNRSLFCDRLLRDIVEADGNDCSIGILLIDIDSFKDVNDSLGHERGDSLLNKIARRFDLEIKINETLARLGGDEFIIVLPDHNQQQVIQRAEKFIDSLKDAFSVEQNTVVVSASIGVAIYPEHGKNIDNLLSHADFAMHEAKSCSDKICTYDPDSDHLAQDHLALVADVRKALDEKQFELHYQPKISAKSGQVVSAEALGRWYSKGRGNVSPNIFIGVMEQNGLIDDYTYWAIETALAQAKKWKQDSKDGQAILRVAVNLSLQTVMHPKFKQKMDDIIKDETAGELLTFEITENLFRPEFDRLNEILEHICALGVELSIDDYGTGYSSLSRLRHFPVSELKIDQSFIKEMVDNKNDQAVVHSTIELAHNLGLTVVAEGVEKKEALALLTELGCDTIQGFLISKPLPVAEFNAFIKNRITCQ